MKYINASEVNTLEELREVLPKGDAEVSVVAIIGDSKLFSSLWEHSNCGVPKQASDLFIACVDYGFIRHTEFDLSLSPVRNTAVWELFRQWKSLNTTRAKTPFNCKAFREFINIDKYCSEAMYVVFQRGGNVQ